jgi:hypothetical protein
MDEAFEAYGRGRADGSAGRRDGPRAADARTGPDYRIGFLDARLEIFRMLAEARRLLDGDPL